MQQRCSAVPFFVACFVICFAPHKRREDVPEAETVKGSEKQRRKKQGDGYAELCIEESTLCADCDRLL